MTIRNSFLITVLVFALALSGCASDSVHTTPETVKEELRVPEIELPAPTKKSDSQQLNMYYDGLLAGRAYIRNKVVYISPESICDYYGIDVAVEATDISFTLESTQLHMSGTATDQYMLANYRYLYTPERYMLENGRLYLSEDVIERVFGVKVTVFGDPQQVDISTDGISIISGGANYYDVNFSSEELFWLPRIIYAETRGQALAGLIGVGNVVHNRVAHEGFPDTVFEVIFDNKHAIQFTPAATGAVLGDPDERSVVAAYLCLEGYNTVGNSLYFVNPKKANSEWFEEELQFVCSIGDHDFYA